MRHRVMGRKLNRTSAHRRAMRRNLVQSLFEHGRIRTTIPKAKEVRAMAEKLVTLALDGSLAARQLAESILTDRSIIPKEHQADYDRLSDAKREKALRMRSGRRYRENRARGGMKFTAESLIRKLFVEIAPRMKRRIEKVGSAGGYTRIIKLSDRRIGDATQLAFLELVAEDDAPRTRNKSKTQRKRRAQVKYNVYAGKPRAPRQRRKSAKADIGANVADAPAPQSAESGQD